MSLSGNLSDFSVLETLQVIGMQKKTGILEIQAGRRRKELHFHEGRLLDCRPTRPEDPDPFLEALVGLGRCDGAFARRMRSLPREEADASLRRQGALDSETFLSIKALVLQGTVDTILLWDRGRFQFTSQPVAPPSDRAWNVEQVLLESMRRLDEGADLKAGAFVPHGITRKTGAAPGSREDATPAELELERAVLRLSDGRRTLLDLTRMLAVADYDLLNTVRHLAEVGAVQVEPRRRTAAGPQLLLEQPRRLRNPLLPGLLILLAGACAGSGWLARDLMSTQTWPPIAQHLEARKEFELRRSLMHALEIYRIRTRLYPAELGLLVDADLWPRAKEGWLRAQIYQRNPDGGSYRLAAESERIQSAAPARLSTTPLGLVEDPMYASSTSRP